MHIFWDMNDVMHAGSQVHYIQASAALNDKYIAEQLQSICATVACRLCVYVVRTCVSVTIRWAARMVVRISSVGALLYFVII